MIDLISKDWGEEISEVSTQSEYQQAKVRVILQNDPEDKGKFDFDLNEYVGGQAPEVIYEGPARYAPIRWGVDSRNTHLYNSSTMTRLRFQFKDGALSDRRVPYGTEVVILEAPRARHMEGTSATVTSDVQNSSNAARTLETEINSDHSFDGDE